MGEFGVSHKGKASISHNKSLLGLDVKVVQSPEALFHNKMTMMAHHNHHHRPLSSPFDADFSAGDGDGPPTYMSFTNHINLVSGASVLGPAIRGGCAAASAPVRTLQPFDISPPTTFKPSGGMSASLGFPFTSAQWRELERQTMIYKYMMASVPVPPDLLIPTSFTPSSRSSCMDGGFNLRLASSTDPEPGRCRRTDGKKWRCSRDVAPNHKYCERHMHRGRPRSRKPVEVNTNTTTPISINNNGSSNHQSKRARHECNPFPTADVSAAISNSTSRKEGSSSHILASPTTQPYLESSLSLANFGLKAATFNSVASVSANKEPRGLDSMLNGVPMSLGASDSEWQSLMHNKVGMSSESSCHSTEPHYLNSLALYSSGMDQQNRRHPLFLNPLVVPMEDFQLEKPRSFIDAWSNAAKSNANTNSKNSAASVGKLPLSSLDLSMGGGAGNEDVGNVNMGLGLMNPSGNTHTDTKISLSNWLNPAPWVPSALGGPLAEVLRSSTVAATNEATSNTPSPATTNVESPSGVLQKTVVSLSDSSSNSSPTVASSRANSEMSLLRFQSNVN